MLTATTSFIQAVEKWVSAMQADDFSTAKRHAEFVKAQGDLLAIRPEFRKCFQKHCASYDAQDALNCLSKFIVCATECREQALKN